MPSRKRVIGFGRFQSRLTRDNTGRYSAKSSGSNGRGDTKGDLQRRRIPDVHIYVILALSIRNRLR